MSLKPDQTGSSTRIRTGVSALRGQCPGPLDDRAVPVSLPAIGAENPGTPPVSTPSGTDGAYINEATGIQTRIPSPDVPIRDLSSRECDCPDWVIRCAHFAGEWLALHVAPVDGTLDLYAVCSGAEPPTYMAHRQGHTHTGQINLVVGTDAALAAFHDAEARLLNGELG